MSTEFRILGKQENRVRVKQKLGTGLQDYSKFSGPGDVSGGVMRR